MSESPSREQVRQQIAREIARVHEDSYGVAATCVEVAAHESFVAVVMDVGLTRGEETLVDAGSADTVVATREAFQTAIEATYKAIVERATGRRVESFASRSIIEENGSWACEVFRLGPAAGR